MMARRIIYTFVTLLVLFVAFYVTGVLAPAVYENEIEATFTDRPIDIWKNLTSLETISERKPDVVHVEQLSENYEAVTWRETLKNGQSRTFRVLDREAPSHFKVERFLSDDGVTGVWTYEMYEIENYTIVRVHEVSLNQNVWKRAWYTVLGRSILLRREIKALRVSLFDRLLYTQ